MPTERIFKRKIYERILKWKEASNGNSALLVQGARRIGKSTIVEEFARREYASYILIDFTKRFDSLTSLGLELHFVKNDKRFTVFQTDVVNQLEPEKNIIEIRHIVEQIHDFLRAFGKVDEDV